MFHHDDKLQYPARTASLYATVGYEEASCNCYHALDCQI